MTTGERLVNISTLTTGTALDHFLNISTGTGTGETRVYNSYPIKYLGTLKQNIRYISSKKVPILYVKSKGVSIKYLEGGGKVLITYIEKEKINIKFICKP